MPSPSLPTGIFAACLTPFHVDTTTDAEALTEHACWLLSHGCDGLLLFGTTGEGFSLTADERLELLEALLEAEIPSHRLLVGTGASALPDVVRMTRRATSYGVGGVLVLPPFHYREVTAEGIFRMYDQLIQHVGTSALQLYLYHFPQLSGVPIPFSVIEDLKDAYPSQIAGIKDSSGDWDHTKALCRTFPELQVYSGTERLLLPVLRAGGSGCISATVNLTAPLAGQVFSSWQKENAPASSQERLASLRASFSSLPTIPTLKHVLARCYNDPDWKTVRPPLSLLSREKQEALQPLIERLTSMIDLPRPT